MSLWKRLLTGDTLRKTRLHTMSGNLVTAEALRFLPRALLSTLLRKGFGYLGHSPWLGYRATARLDHLIQKDWIVLEFGSGMSSLFFAARCLRLISVESDPAWHGEITKRLAAEGLRNVDYRLRDPTNYVDHPDIPDRSVDLVVVDGIRRDLEAAAALHKVKPGGYVLYDNSDVPWPEYQQARRLLLAAAQDVEVFNDFYPFHVQVNESMLIRVRE